MNFELFVFGLTLFLWFRSSANLLAELTAKSMAENLMNILSLASQFLIDFPSQ